MAYTQYVGGRISTGNMQPVQISYGNGTLGTGGATQEEEKKTTTTESGESTASGGEVGSVLKSLLDEFTRLTNDANAANESRYGEAKGELTSLRDRVLGALDSLGISQMADLNRSFSDARSRTVQDMTERGLANSTVLPSIMAGLERQKAEAAGKLYESREMQRIGLDMNTTQALTGLIERREDVAPSLDMLAQLAMAMGQYATGQGSQAGADGMSAGSNPASPTYFTSRYGSAPRLSDSARRLEWGGGGGGGAGDPLAQPQIFPSLYGSPKTAPLLGGLQDAYKTPTSIYGGSIPQVQTQPIGYTPPTSNQLYDYSTKYDPYSYSSFDSQFAYV